jgi:NAD(P)H-hydrate epimerase
MWHPGPEILTVSQAAEVDRLAALSGIPMDRLMENAGRKVANEIAKRWSPCAVLVLCGPGNNGGDGYVVARHLQARGYDVDLVVYGNHGKASDEARHMASLWSGPVRSFNADDPVGADLIVDAVFGAGLSRGLHEGLSRFFSAAAIADIPVVAIDVPSGLHGDRAMFVDDVPPWHATLCVTFFRKKPAHVLMPGRIYCGEIVCADIGIADGMIAALAALPLANADSARGCVEIFSIPHLRPGVLAHKHARGHCFVVSGPASMTGAARLAATAALRAGAGLVTVLGRGDAVPILAGHLTAVMVRACDAPNGFREVLSDARPVSVVAGPGLGVTAETRQIVAQLLSARRPAVLDADALTAFEADPAELFGQLPAEAVLTPHVGEFNRLFPEVIGRLANRIEAAREAARRAGAVILLKGPDTVIAAPDGRVAINTNAPADLATAGSGDVLAGIIGARLAQGEQAFEAACAGAFLHGKCGRLAGPGLVAEDLPAMLPRALAEP